MTLKININMGNTFIRKKILANMELFSGTVSGAMSTNVYSPQTGN